MRDDYDYEATETILSPSGVRAYNAGDGVPADVVDTWDHVQVGQNVKPAHADVIARPAKNAARGEWEKYALGQGMARDEAENLTRADLIAAYPEDTQPAGEQTAQAAASHPQTDVVALQGGEHAHAVDVEEPGSDARKADWVAYAVARGLDEKTANDSTIAQLQEFDYDHLA
jgi:hypothetical protein